MWVSSYLKVRGFSASIGDHKSESLYVGWCASGLDSGTSTVQYANAPTRLETLIFHTTVMQMTLTFM